MSEFIGRTFAVPEEWGYKPGQKFLVAKIKDGIILMPLPKDKRKAKYMERNLDGISKANMSEMSLSEIEKTIRQVE